MVAARAKGTAVKHTSTLGRDSGFEGVGLRKCSVAKVIIERKPGGYFGIWRSIVIETNGNHYVKVRPNAKVERAITPGVHYFQARMDWVRSQIIEVDVERGDVIQFTCRASGNARAHQISLIRVFKAHDGPRASRHEQAEVRDADRLLSWTAVLGISSDASVKEIRGAYLKRIGQYHPDRVASLGEEIRQFAERRSKEINVAYSLAMEQRQKR